jgi:putative GTP pyrophosphokinase
MSSNELKTMYSNRYHTALVPIAERLEIALKKFLRDTPRVDRISVRAKSIDRFLKKADKKENDQIKYTNPLSQIQDQIGARIVTFYNCDIEPVSKFILKYFPPIEVKALVPDSISEFGYEGKHFILRIPKDYIGPEIPKELRPRFFELQIKTLFEHSWAEANHDIAYKPQTGLTPEQRRKIAFTAAQAWGADQIFNELVKELIKNKN